MSNRVTITLNYTTQARSKYFHEQSKEKIILAAVVAVGIVHGAAGLYADGARRADTHCRRSARKRSASRHHTDEQHIKRHGILFALHFPSVFRAQ